MISILLSNDDGYDAPGLKALADELSAEAHITVVAPDRNRSGASNSLTLDAPLRVHKTSQGFYSVAGTPTDCVHLAITGFLDHEPDIVISGINTGANLGDDVLYSGTVAAAMEGRFLGVPAMAMSLVGAEPRYYGTAARIAHKLVQRLQREPLPPATILNVNVPDLPWERLSGMQATRLGSRHRSEPVIRSKDPRGHPVYWVGVPGDAADNGPGTDFAAVASGHVSVTPLDVDLTRYAALDQVERWIKGLP